MDQKFKFQFIDENGSPCNFLARKGHLNSENLVLADETIRPRGYSSDKSIGSARKTLARAVLRNS